MVADGRGRGRKLDVRERRKVAMANVAAFGRRQRAPIEAGQMLGIRSFATVNCAELRNNWILAGR